VFLLGAVHPRKEAPILRIAMFGAFLALGAAMIHVSRDGSYYAVMVGKLSQLRNNANLAQKQAPGIGTLLIFCAVELQTPESLAALVLVAIYALWHGNGRLFD